jgi:hypothetical protein
VNVLINRQIFEQTSWDSGALTGTGVVVHKFEEPGEYGVTVLEEEEVIERSQLTVTEEAPGTEAPPASVEVDLKKLRGRGLARRRPERLAGEPGERLVTRAGGYASFYDWSGKGTTIVAERTRGGREARRFDSRRLERGDFFAVTLIRPGTYSLANVHNRARGEITVAYPTVGDKPYRPPEPVQVNCARNRFEPDKIDLQPGQGIVFHFNTPSRIKIDLVEPHEGLQEEVRRQKVVSWRKPQAP